MLAIGAVIGAGIFGAIGTAAAGQIGPNGEIIRVGAGPALVFSFLLLGGACALAALCYAELAAMIPQAGSAYAYSYATLGELVAWIIGWDLILEYAVGNVAVAISWGDYFTTLLRGFGLVLPPWLDDRLPDRAAQLGPGRPRAAADARRRSPASRSSSTCRRSPSSWRSPGCCCAARARARPPTTSWWASSWPCWRCSSASARSTSRPPTTTRSRRTASRGIHQGAAIVFFAYIGFDAISTAAEETKNPQRNLPIGILGGLAICTVIYVVIGAGADRDGARTSSWRWPTRWRGRSSWRG